MLIRPFDPERDRPACHRIWREVGWLKAGEEAAMDKWLDASRCLVAEIDGEAECLVMAASGYVRHLSSDLPLSAITGVTTSYIARKQGLAARMLAQLVANEAEAGALVSGLSMFEQGYYNLLGYGTTSYLHRVAFDPSSLNVTAKAGIPCRLTKEHWADIHANRLARRKGHGACTLISPKLTEAELAVYENGFGLGYRDESGRLTHHIWLSTSNVESGPYDVGWVCYRTLDELMELLALMRNLGDQVKLFRMEEPPEIVLQDLLKKPFKQMQMTEQGKYASHIRSRAPYQFRICDLPKCVTLTRLPFGEARFNLELSDPITSFLPPESAWKGAGGAFRVTLGVESSAEPGTDPSLPTLSCSVDTFTRLWLGARTATSLAVTDGLQAPEELLSQLDVLMRLPTPMPDWDF